MQYGLIGLGRMGYNIALRTMEKQHQVVAFDLNGEAVKQISIAGATGVSSLEDLVKQLPAPRVVWIMVPAGAPVQSTIDKLLPHLQSGDVIIDGGNSNYKDSQRRAQELGAKGISFLDCGVSGGIWGLEYGFNLMIGGPDDAFARAEPIFSALTVEGGYAHVGPSGAGHYAKMIHNGIEYGMMQAYGEGFEILHKSPFGFNLEQLARLWNRGSVVRSWLLDLAADAFAKEGNDLSHIKDWVADSGEGRWTVQEAIDMDIPAPIITLALMVRLRSREGESFSSKVVAALRNQFGGHMVKKE
jgi:6-phosphogluconate dehydrogenase